MWDSAWPSPALQRAWMPQAPTAPAELPLLRNSKSSQQELGPEEEEFRDNRQSDGVKLEGH